MSATLSLSPLPPLSTPSNYPYNSNPISNSYHKAILFASLPHSPTNPITPIRSSSYNKKENPIAKSSHQNDSFLSEPFFRSNSATKMPTAPWMKGPLVLQPNQVLDLSKSRNDGNFTNDEDKKHSQSLTERVKGGRGKNAMKKIFMGIGELQESHDLEKKETQKSPEQIKLDFLFKDSQVDGNSDFGGRMPWERDERVIYRRMKKEKVVTAAELSLDGVLLERLRGEAKRIRKWVKVNKIGVTQAVVDQIRFIWKSDELVMLKFTLPLCRNMDRAREIVEVKTGGLVVWTKKDALVIYRGVDYQSNPKVFLRMHTSLSGRNETYISDLQVNSAIEEIVGRKIGMDQDVPIDGSLYEREADRLLDGLGPRFIDWWRPKPLPVDADLLPEVVPGFKPPFRLCPPKARSKLADDELTYLRKLSHPLPTHFVLGRNRNLQGLAAAILKLWEKCHIAKIAVKLGIPNTNNEEMADELKTLTGGVLLLRNKFFIIIYRGKDFLPCRVANLVAEREIELKQCHLQEEAARVKAAGTICLTVEPSIKVSSIGSLSEFQDIQSEHGDMEDGNKELKVQLEADKAKLEKELRQQEHKLFVLNVKIKKAVKNLEKLNLAWRPAETDVDQEMITPEERLCLRKIGLKMDNSLALGRRGVFEGVIEGLHQHWKHREVVKVITMQKVFSQIVYTARLLQRESGGILISVDKLKEGHAIILYRGKNYKRPSKLMIQNLLSKREAMQRSIEMQRVGSLKFFAYQRQKTISDLKSKLDEMRETCTKEILRSL